MNLPNLHGYSASTPLLRILNAWIVLDTKKVEDFYGRFLREIAQKKSAELLKEIPEIPVPTIFIGLAAVGFRGRVGLHGHQQILG